MEFCTKGLKWTKEFTILLCAIIMISSLITGRR